MAPAVLFPLNGQTEAAGQWHRLMALVKLERWQAGLWAKRALGWRSSGAFQPVCV